MAKQIPTKVKHRKQQKGSLRGLANTGQFVDFGDFGMQATQRGRITNRQIEACRVAVTRHFARKGKVWIRIFPHKPVTKKPLEVRMGKGKGGVDHWVAQIKPGRILFEVGNVSEEDAKRALAIAAGKLPIKTRFVKRLERA